MNVTTKTTRSLRTVAAVVAVAVACSTGAYAAGAAITSSKQIKAGVVNTGDIKNGTVKVKDLNKKTVQKFTPKANEAFKNFDAPGNPQLIGPWQVHGGAYQAPGFRIDNDGDVHLRGAVKQAADAVIPGPIAVLPAGYRPAACEMFSVATFDGIGNQDPEGAVADLPERLHHDVQGGRRPLRLPRRRLVHDRLIRSGPTLDGPFSHGEEGPFGVPAYRPAVSRRRASASRASRAWSRSRREATTAAR